ncbi:MAG: NUDIX domain-containing protein [Armatimonadota bacterium]
MMPKPPHFRNSVKAVIVRDSAILLTVNRDQWGEFLLLPGGGQDFGESMPEALQRECREELGCEVLVGDMIGARDYIGLNHEFAEYDPHMHQVEIMFACQLAPGAEPDMGPLPDDQGDWAQTGIEWVPLADLPSRRIYPSVLREWLPTLPEPQQRYLGDVN